MPVTRRWVHSGLVLVMLMLSACVAVLAAGASRSLVTNSGLNNTPAPDFNLRDAVGAWKTLDHYRGKFLVMIVGDVSSPQLTANAKTINQIVLEYEQDPHVSIVGVQFDPRAGLLGQTDDGGVWQQQFPGLSILTDVDGSAARAYRVNETPTLIVIDPEHVIRARLPITNDGVAIAVSETLASLKKPSLNVSALATDAMTSPH